MRQKTDNKEQIHLSKDWLSTSGVLELFRQAPVMTENFNDVFGFNLRYYGTPPERLDGDEDKASSVAFYIVRDNRLIPERRYCLYVRVQDEQLSAHIGYIRDGNIVTITDLESISQVRSPQDSLYNWLRSLLRASCEKLA